MHNNIEYISQLLNRKIRAKNSDLDNILTEKEDEKLFNEICNTREALLKDKKVIKVDIDKEYKHFSNSISGNSRTIFLSTVSIAASLMLLIGSYFLFIQEKEPEKLSVVESIKPGTSRAVLYLGDGRKIDLGKKNIQINDGDISGISNDSLQGLQYNKVIAKQTEQIVYNTVKIPKGGEYQMTLADGTKVWLNSESEMRFPVHFTKDKREIFINGEAYFKVAHNKKKPFIARLDKGSIEVLGTEFNINAYNDEEDMVTTLIKGSVKFISSNKKHNQILKPNQQIVYNSSQNDFSLRNVDIRPFIAWKEGKFYFKSMELEKIMRQLERWYNFNVFYSNEELKTYKFRGVILKDMTLNNALKIIEETTDIRFKVKGETVTIYKKY